MGNLTVNKKRFVIRIVLLLLILAFACFLFRIGKEHEVLLDNKDVSIAGTDYKAAEYMRVRINGSEESEMEFYAGDRDVVKLQGPSHSIKVTILEEDTEKVIKETEQKFDFGTESRLMISLPALAQGAANVYLPLPSQQDTQDAENKKEEAKEEAAEKAVPPIE